MKPRPVFLTAMVVFALLSALCAQEAETPLTPSQTKELKIWTGQLSDANTSAKTKFDAAVLLFERSYPQAGRALLDLLSAKDGRDAKIAIAEAIAQASGGPRKEFIEPLMAMLTGKDSAVRVAAGKALLTYKNQGVTDLLIAVVRDGGRDREVRLDTMAVLQRILDKKVVASVVELLGDSDPAIGKAAMETLPRLTNIYGYNARQWRAWWQKSKDKPLSEWLGEWAENLAKHARVLEEDNAALRSRLTKALEEVYASTPPDRREAVLIGFLHDPIAEVRLVGASLVGSWVSSGAKVSSAVATEIRKLLPDDDLRVRKAAAALAGSLADAQFVAPLLQRLESEADLAARQVVLTSLGQLQDPSAVPAVLKDVGSEDNEVAAAAAVALERIAAKHKLRDKDDGSTSKAILDRYAAALKADRSKDVIALREALLRAMGTVCGRSAIPAVREALKDEAAMIRLAAVSSLGELGDGSLADAVVPLVSDQDRGVRQAAIVVLGKLGGEKYIQHVIERARASSEPDAAVRNQARDVTLDILKKCDTQVLWNVIGQLQNQPDGRDLQIQILEILVDRLETEKSKYLHAAHRHLGLVLKQAGKAGEAAAHLRRAFELLEKEKNPQARVLWSEWLEAMYDHDVEGFIKAMAEQEDEQLFLSAYADLGTRLEKLKNSREWSKLIILTAASIEHLKPRLTADKLQALGEILAQAKQEQRAVEEQDARKLVADLLAADEASRRKAEAAVKAMGDRAVKPLLEELRKTVTVENPNPAAEKALLAMLSQIAPDLKGYDAAAKKEDRLKLIDKWLQGVQ